MALFFVLNNIFTITLLLEQAPNHPHVVEGLRSAVMRVQRRTRVGVARQQHSKGQRARLKATRLVERGWLGRTVHLKMNREFSSYRIGARLVERAPVHEFSEFLFYLRDLFGL